MILFDSKKDGRQEKCDNRQTRYDYIRVFLTILVVLGHCAFIEIETPFGGVHYKSLMETTNLDSSIGIRPFLVSFSNMIYSFHMPSFFALAGALFEKGYANGKWDSFSKVLKAKIERLMLPCIIVWFAYNIPLKLISRYYSGVSFQKVFLQFLFSNNVYLWYLEALFFCFLFAWVIRRFCGMSFISITQTSHMNSGYKA